MSVAVVYVHGLWLRGHEAFLLKRRLSETLAGEAYSFTYPSVRSTLADNAVALRRYLATIRTDTLHVVAHSLGGLVVLKMFEREAGAVLQLADDVGGGRGMFGGEAGEPLPGGRIVLLGSPVQGSGSAQRLARLPFGRALLGLSGADLLPDVPERRWNGVRELGVIAGTAPFGMGRLLGPMGGAPNDGTVLLEETLLPNATDRLELRVSHSGLAFSAVVARQTGAFLRSGRFMR